jgi:hypothetical protein
MLCLEENQGETIQKATALSMRSPNLRNILLRLFRLKWTGTP